MDEKSTDPNYNALAAIKALRDYIPRRSAGGTTWGVRMPYDASRNLEILGAPRRMSRSEILREALIQWAERQR